MSTSMFLRLCSVAPRMPERHRAVERIAREVVGHLHAGHAHLGVGRRSSARLRPERYSAVSVCARFSSSGEPKKTISPPRSPGPGPHVEELVGLEHDLRVVLDHDERVAGVAQALHHVDHAAHVARVQADRGLVEHEERVDERGAERGGEVDALHLAAGERARLAVEREVAQAHLAEVAQARADLAEQELGRLVERRRAACESSRRSRSVVQPDPSAACSIMRARIEQAARPVPRAAPRASGACRRTLAHGVYAR